MTVILDNYWCWMGLSCLINFLIVLATTRSLKKAVLATFGLTCGFTLSGLWRC